MRSTSSPRQVATADAPAAIGPYSQGVAAGGFLFVSGQLPLDPETGNPVAGEIEARVDRCLKNLTAVARAAGTDLSRAVKLTVFLTDLSLFARVNAVYARHFPGMCPARSAVQVAALPKGVDIEIEAIIQLGSEGGPA